jgi:hypothetical protein
MSMNLIAIAGTPAYEQAMAGKLVGVGGPGMSGCGCGVASAGMGAYARPVGATEEERSTFNWLALGFFSAAAVIAYFVMRGDAARSR